MTQTLMGHSPSRLPICLNSPADGRERQLKDSRPQDLPIYYIANIETIKLSQIETVDQGESLSDSKKKEDPSLEGPSHPCQHGRLIQGDQWIKGDVFWWINSPEDQTADEY